MKRYLVFKYDQYYPSGGLNDVYAEADTLEEAYSLAAGSFYDYVEIFDRIDGVYLPIKELLP